MIAVEIHQSSGTSSDISFNLELIGSSGATVTRGPYLQMTAPTSTSVRWRTNTPDRQPRLVRHHRGQSHHRGRRHRRRHRARGARDRPRAEHEVLLRGGGRRSGQLAGGHRRLLVHHRAGGGDGQADADLGARRSGHWQHQPARRPRRVSRPTRAPGHRSLAHARRQRLSQRDGRRVPGRPVRHLPDDAAPEPALAELRQPRRGEQQRLHADRARTSTCSRCPPSARRAAWPRAPRPTTRSTTATSTSSRSTRRRATGRRPARCSRGSRNDLAANTRTWIIAFWHHPPYSKGGHNSDTDARADPDAPERAADPRGGRRRPRARPATATPTSARCSSTGTTARRRP